MVIKNLHVKLPELTIAAGFVLLFLVLSTYPLADGDFFWHIHSGKQILADHKLPDRDTFSFTTGRFVENQGADQRISVILKQYWLAQILLFELYDQFGTTAIVMLRVLVFIAILAILYRWGKSRAPALVSGFFTILTASLLLEYPTERPQLFTFLLTVVILWVLEKVRCDEHWRRGAAILLLPGLMLLWGNLHGGYLLGVGFCLIYLVGHCLGPLQGRPVDRRALLILLLASGIAFVNPCGFKLAASFWSTDKDYLAMVYENISPIAAFRHGDYFGAYWAGVLLLAGSFAVLRRRMALEHGMILICVLVLSLSGLRYMIFLLMCFPLYIGAYAALSRWQSVVAISLSLLIFLATANFSAAGRFGLSGSFPRQAAEFMREKLPGKNIYNHYDWGGYLGFMLPANKVFIDGRGLVPAVVREYNAIEAADGYREKLALFGAETIIMPGVSAGSGRIFPLVKALYSDPGWQLVYWDEAALVFVPAERGHEDVASLDKKFIFTHILRQIDRLLADANRSESLALLQTKAESQMLLGDYGGARESCRAVLRIDADSEFARKLLSTLEQIGNS